MEVAQDLEKRSLVEMIELSSSTYQHQLSLMNQLDDLSSGLLDVKITGIEKDFEALQRTVRKKIQDRETRLNCVMEMFELAANSVIKELEAAESGLNEGCSPRERQSKLRTILSSSRRVMRLKGTLKEAVQMAEYLGSAKRECLTVETMARSYCLLRRLIEAGDGNSNEHRQTGKNDVLGADSDETMRVDEDWGNDDSAPGNVIRFIKGTENYVDFGDAELYTYKPPKKFEHVNDSESTELAAPEVPSLLKSNGGNVAGEDLSKGEAGFQLSQTASKTRNTNTSASKPSVEWGPVDNNAAVELSCGGGCDAPLKEPDDNRRESPELELVAEDSAILCKPYRTPTVTVIACVQNSPSLQPNSPHLMSMQLTSKADPAANGDLKPSNSLATWRRCEPSDKHLIWRLISACSRKLKSQVSSLLFMLCSAVLMLIPSNEAPRNNFQAPERSGEIVPFLQKKRSFPVNGHRIKSTFSGHAAQLLIKTQTKDAGNNNESHQRPIDLQKKPLTTANTDYQRSPTNVNKSSSLRNSILYSALWFMLVFYLAMIFIQEGQVLLEFIHGFYPTVNLRHAEPPPT